MLVCQWHLDIVFGKQAEAVRIMRAWGAEKFASSRRSWQAWPRRSSGPIRMPWRR
jgi:hypothetical protein